jgi:hypothetical protein
MSVIVAVAYDQWVHDGPPRVTWQELTLAQVIPANIASVLLPQLQRWRRFVQPIFKNGDIVGIRISSLMSDRRARLLRQKVEPFLQGLGNGAEPQNAGGPAPGTRVLSLTKHGLRIPARNVLATRALLQRLTEVELQYDADEEHVVALLFPPGAALNGVYAVLESKVVTVEPAQAGRREHLLGLLFEDLETLADNS